MEGYQFPPGFRFHPTDQELITHYLRSKVASSPSQATCIIADIDIYKFNPWELPDKAFFGEGEWFFFSPRDRKYPNGSRPNRTAASGYWKATSTDKPILNTGSSQCLGVKKHLVFYKGRPPKGIKTDWVMHEYRLIDASPSLCSLKDKSSMRLDEWVLCRVRHKGSTQMEDEHQGSSRLALQVDTKKRKQQQLRETNNNLHQCSDQQLLAYLLSSEEGGQSRSESSELGSTSSCELNSMVSDGCTADKEQPSVLVSSMLGSIKRALLFGPLDELMLLPPSKRLHLLSNDCWSPADSVSVDGVFQL